MDPQYPQYNQPNYNQTMYQTMAQPNLLVFGILSLALCGFFGIPGIILGAIGRKKGKAFIAQGGVLTGASKVGYILSLVGLILGIVLTVYFVIVIIVAIAAAGNGSYYSYY